MDNRALDAPVLAISVASAARMLGLSRASVYRLAKDDPTFPKVRRIGKRAARIRLADLTAWLDEKQQAPIASRVDPRASRLRINEPQFRSGLVDGQVGRAGAKVSAM